MNDIAAISAMQQAQLAEQIGMAVARKSLDATEQQGEAVMSLLQDALDFARQSQPALHPGQSVEFVG
jgi:hypothetical protein